MSYGKTATLLLGDLKLSHGGPNDLRLAFDVKRDKSRDPNAATIRLWNLAPTTRERLEGSPRIFCDLQVGYRDEGSFGIFSGVLLGVESSRDGQGFVTELTLADDDKQRAALNRVHRNFPAGTQTEMVLRELIKATGLGQGNVAEISKHVRIGGSPALTRAWTASGSALNELQTFVRSAGLGYTIQNRELLFLGVGADTSNAPVLHSDNVMGSPTVDAEDTVSFTCRMLPDLIPGRAFRLITESKAGDYVAVSTRHYGDTHSNDWSVDVQGDPFSKIKKKGLKING